MCSSYLLPSVTIGVLVAATVIIYMGLPYSNVLEDICIALRVVYSVYS